jgi:hypothetical protein
MNEVEARYSRNEFPPVSSLVLGDIILGCWEQRHQSMSQVVEMLDRIFAERMVDEGEGPSTESAGKGRWFWWILRFDFRLVEKWLK